MRNILLLFVLAGGAGAQSQSAVIAGAPIRQARTAIALSEKLLQQGDYPAAEAALAGALRDLGQGPDEHNLARAALLCNLGVIRHNLGRYHEAEDLLRRSATAMESELGPRHPRLAVPLGNLISVYVDTREYGRAERTARRAVELLRFVDGRDRASLLTQLGRLRFRRGDAIEAERLFIEALAIYEAEGHHAGTGAVLNNLALLRVKNDPAAAADLLERALPALERAHGSEHPALIPLLANLGWSRFRVAQHVEAEARLTRAIRISLSTLGPDHVLSGDLLALYAEFLLKTGRKAEAKPFAKRASAIRARTGHLGRYSIDITDLAPRRP